MEENSVDAIVTDPPYGLKFMGKGWDHGLPGVEFWESALRVLRPSHYLLAFGGTRTWHRLACSIEDSGFEVMDTLMWLYGSGFPKHKSKLKPAWEPIIMARKPGTPALPLGIDACRIATAESLNGGAYAKNGKERDDGWGMQRTGGAGEFEQPQGRWPANVILDEEAGAILNAQSGTLKSGKAPATGFVRSSDKTRNAYGTFEGNREEPTVLIGDSGGASRFFYCAKASRSERNAGLDGMEATKRAGDGDGSIQQPKLDRQSPRENWTPHATANHHPTVKPVTLMSWLVKLVAQPNEVVLDPFMGSGTTGVACVAEGRKFLGIEKDAEYVKIAQARIAHARKEAEKAAVP
jgi:site-specific DNA-methyltransferase (adenine-specific)